MSGKLHFSILDRSIGVVSAILSAKGADTYVDGIMNDINAGQGLTAAFRTMAAVAIVGAVYRFASAGSAVCRQPNEQLQERPDMAQS